MKKRILPILGIVLIVGLYFGYDVYQKVWGTIVPEDIPSEFVTIPSGLTFGEVADKLYYEGYINNKGNFSWLSKQMKYAKDEMRAGRFKVKAGMNNLQLVRLLRSGEQATVRIAVHNKWDINQVAGLFAEYLDADSLSFANVFQDEELLSEYALTKGTAMSLFIPDSYDFYWNETPEKVLKKMAHYRNQFWNEDRLEKARKLNLTPTEVYTLASIVEKETNNNSEKQRVAGVYYNRLQKGMLLQADPTAKFASGDYKLNRVTFDHTAIQSPYNTYVFAGLPPGPIYMASKTSIDKTLNLENHDYLYFCAKPGGVGEHAFAKTLRQHNVNAAKYHKYAREQRRKKRMSNS